MNFVRKQNIRAIKNLENLDPTIVYSVGALLLVLAIILFYFYRKLKNKKDFYNFIYGNNLKKRQNWNIINEPQKYPDFFNEKWLEKNNIPNTWIKIGHWLCLYLAIFFLLFATTLFIGKPLGMI